MEKKLKDLQLEVEMLREGVGARDEALILMREEVDRSVEILGNATESREVRFGPGASIVFHLVIMLLCCRSARKSHKDLELV
jgi:hypothetical protein